MKPLTRQDYEAAVRRLARRIAGFSMPFVAHERLRAAVMDRFDDADFAFAAALLLPPRNIWCTVRTMLGPIGRAPSSDATDFDLGWVGTAHGGRRATDFEVHLCRSLAEGVAYVGRIALHAGVVLQDILPTAAGGFELRAKGVPVFQIEPVRFQHVEPAAVAQVDRALRSLRRFGHEALAVGRLRLLPGLHALSCTTPAAEATGPALIAKLPNLVDTMRTMMREDVGLKIENQAAQELVAALFGATDWAELTRHEHDGGCRLEPVVMTFRAAPGAQEDGHRFFCSAAAAIAGFCNELERAPKPLFPHFVGSTDGTAVTMYASTVIAPAADTFSDSARAPVHLPLANWRIKIDGLTRVAVPAIDVAEVERWLPTDPEAQLRALIAHLLHDRATPPPQAVPILSAREVQVLGLLAQGKKTKSIAAILNIAVGTVQLHLDTIRSKLGVSTRIEAVTQAIAQGLIQRQPTQSVSVRVH